MQKLLPRTLGAVFLAALLLFCLMSNDMFLLCVFGIVFGVTVWESRKLLRTEGKKVITLPAMIFSVVFAPLYGLTGTTVFPVALYFLAMAATMIAQVMSIKAHDNMADAVSCLQPFVYPLLPECVMVALFVGFPDEVRKTLICSAILFPKIGDMFAYFGGALFGKHLLCPLVSPHKTVEGAVSSVIGGCVMGAGMFYMQRLWGGAVAFPILVSLGLICGWAGIYGDLFASCIKRTAGIKDFSNLLPGHGGLTDVLDSTFLCAMILLSAGIVLFG